MRFSQVKGVFLWLRKAVAVMRAQDAGQIVVTSSTCGVRVVAKSAIYAASKWAVEVR